MKPVIIITPSYDEGTNNFTLNKAYTDYIESAGGQPVIIGYGGSLPDISDVLSMADGLLLSGGVDISPLLFDEEPIVPLGHITPERDIFELEIIRQAIGKNMPIYGICRGMQLLNAACGGTVVQDIYDFYKTKLKHTQNAPKYYASHTIDISKNSLLFSITGKDTMTVNSFHHQAAGENGENIIKTAFAKDGVPEALEYVKSSFVLGVQWHPELMYEKDDTQLEIAKAFITAADKFKRRKT
ncbi:MAG: gamma-glutamyl-gamma-aminobutyrate hydrolase family protein [Lachnospiraceae bacterium]|nr:gamma-glutamyl-gamma-aminobutyrate hydrolase family protein [Lachnospiraceae bacterium]